MNVGWKTLRRIVALLAACTALAGCDPLPGGSFRSDLPPGPLTDLMADYWQMKLRETPVHATVVGEHRYDDQLDDLSDTARIAGIAGRRALLARLDALDLSRDPAGNRLNAELFRRAVTDEITAAELPGRWIPISQQEGPHIALPMLRVSQPLSSREESLRYAARLGAFPRQVEQVIERMRGGMGAGVVPPKVTMAQVVPQLDAQIVDDPARSELFTVWAERRAAKADAGERQAMLDGTRRAVEGYRALRDFVKNEYLPKCTDTVGIGHLPGGAAWYATEVRLHTTTQRTPEDLHAVGMAELERIHGEMRAIMRRVGFEGEIPAFMDHLRQRADLHAQSGAELMSGFAAILKRSDAELPKVFGRLPKTPYTLREIESFRAAAAPAAYYYPAPDDHSRPAYFYVNVFDPKQRPKYTMEALAYHEAMPGHHLQLALAQECRGLPDFRRHQYITAYCEGWGLYSECLGKDLGGYRDPYSDFGRLTFDAWRSCRLVVDTGMHALGWTRQQAIDFMKANTALSQIDIESEVDRYIAWPGQALAYKVGQIEIMRMRTEAAAALGPRFDLRVFHDELLAEGPLPLDLLQTRMDEWLTRQRRPAVAAR
ncbi:MAG: DUF885 domain-containing protein [Phycisphaerae bacterium]